MKIEIKDIEGEGTFEEVEISFKSVLKIWFLGFFFYVLLVSALGLFIIYVLP